MSDQKFQIDISKEPYSMLAGYAKRIATLLQHRRVAGNKDAIGSLDELLGSVYALIMAERLGFQDRIQKPKEDAVILTRAKALTSGEVRTDGKWMAGYHLNSSTYRTAGVHHRILKMITGINTTNMQVLDDAAAKAYVAWTGQGWKRAQLQKVDAEANDLKHTKEGIYTKRRLTYREAIIAVDQLLTIFEAWANKAPKNT